MSLTKKAPYQIINSGQEKRKFFGEWNRFAIGVAMPALWQARKFALQIFGGQGGT